MCAVSRGGFSLFVRAFITFMLILDALGPLLGALRVLPGAIGALLERFWAQLGPNLGPKSVQNGTKNDVQMHLGFGSVFWPIFGAKRVQK